MNLTIGLLRRQPPRCLPAGLDTVGLRQHRGDQVEVFRLWRALVAAVMVMIPLDVAWGIIGQEDQKTLHILPSGGTNRFEAYPRERGATSGAISGMTMTQGLSPRTRGNLR